MGHANDNRRGRIDSGATAPPDAEAQRRADPVRPSAGGEATESVRGPAAKWGDDEVSARRDDVARPSEGGAAAESERAGESRAHPPEEARLSDVPASDTGRPSAAP